MGRCRRGGQEGTLYTGARLAVASEWAASQRDGLSALERAFLSASQEHEREKKADEAEKNRRLQKLVRWLLGTAAASLLLALAAGWQTWRANDASAKATTQARIATSQRLAALSVSERTRRLDLSLLLAVEAVETDRNTFEARDSLIKALQERPELRQFLHVTRGGVSSVAFGLDGKTVAAGYSAGGFSASSPIRTDSLRWS